MRRVRTVVLFGLLYQRRRAECAAVEKLFQTDIFRRETKFLGIHQLHLGFAARVIHPVGFSGFRQSGFPLTTFSGRRGIQSNLARTSLGAPTTISPPASPKVSYGGEVMGMPCFATNFCALPGVGDATANTSASAHRFSERVWI
jgi:hypothetical protein